MRPSLLLVGLVLSGCGGTRPGPAVRPGDSLFDFLVSAEVTSYPATNLPPDVAGALHTPVTIHSFEFGADDWVASGVPPAHMQPFIPDSSIRLWSAHPTVRRWQRSPVTVRVHGEPHERWQPGRDPFPGTDAWWEERAGTLYALSAGPPMGVSVTMSGDPSEYLAPFERQSPVTRPSDLVHTIRLGRISRRALTLPSPGCVTVPLGIMGCDELHVAVGLADRAYERVPDGLRQAHMRSDGVVCAVEVSSKGRWKRIWETTLSDADMDAWSGPHTVSLRPYIGRKVTMRLVTEPGRGGNADFDYAVWGDLHLRGTPATAPSRPHIVLIDLDTLRRDRLGCYGNPRNLTPRIDAWARHATIFTDCVAAAPWTLPSTVTMLTGLAVHQHRVDRFPEAIAEGLTTVSSTLRGAGYETVGYAEGGFVSGDFGFDQGFDTYDCSRFKDPRWHDALEWVRRRRSEHPLFLFLQTYWVHAPYPFDGRFEDATVPYRTNLRGRDIDYPTVIEPQGRGLLILGDEDRRYVADMYDALVLRLDEFVGTFLDSLNDALGNEPSAVFITSDHGEELLEHGLLGHGQSLFRELLEVPLIVRFPGQTSPAIDHRATTGMDLAPTILALAGLPCTLPGLSLCGPSAHRMRVSSQSESVHAILSGGWKLISGPVMSPRGPSAPLQLYDLGRDPGETTDLSPTLPDTTQHLYKELMSYVRGHAAPPAKPLTHLRTGEVRRLEALGYLRHDQPSPSPLPARPDSVN